MELSSIYLILLKVQQKDYLYRKFYQESFKAIFYYIRNMKFRILFLLLLSFELAKGQQVLTENSSNYSGVSNYPIESVKTLNGYFYNLVLNDSILYSDTIFRNNDYKAHTLIISSDKMNKLNWFIDIPKGIYNETFKVNEYFIQLFEYTESELSIRQNKVLNPQNQSMWTLMLIDSNGNDLKLMNIGNEIKDSANSKLYLNGFSIKNNGNYLITGYQLGSINLRGNFYYSDTFMSKYFSLEIDGSGNIVEYKSHFRCLNPYGKISRTIENNNNLIFETSFDSLEIQNKSFSVLNFANNYVNDLALISIDKSTSNIIKYALLIDSSTNGYASNSSIISKGNTILWPVNSATKTLKVNDSIFVIESEHEQVILTIDLVTFQPLSTIFLNAENPINYSLDYYNDTSYVLTCINPGAFLNVNDILYNFPLSNATAFIDLERNLEPNLIYVAYGKGYSMRLTRFTKTTMEFWANYFTNSSKLSLKSIDKIRNLNYLKWRIQSTHYSLSNYTSLKNILQSDLTIFPNPSSSIINIKEKDEFENSEYQIYDLKGDECLTDLLDTSGRIQIDTLPNGMYWLKICNSKKIIFRKFVKD